MASLRQAKSEAELQSMTIANAKKAYLIVAEDYNRLLNLEFIFCPHCGKWKSIKADNFYTSNETVDGIEHFACKECILNMCTDRKRNGLRVDNKQKTIDTFRRLNWCFDEYDYEKQLVKITDAVNERVRSTAVQQLIVMVQSLPQYANKTFKDSKFKDDSEYIEETKINQKTLKNAKKRFGNSYSDEDLMFLENEYQDWITRYECSQKAQEETFQSLALLKLAKRNAIKKGAPTKDIDKSYQDWLDIGNLKPKQNTLDTFSDAQTLGTLIQKYEETRPLPEIDPDLQDVDKIGLYIDAFYRGHASKMLGLKNRFSNIYDRIMSKYTVKQPSYDEETDSEILFDKIFGNKDD